MTEPVRKSDEISFIVSIDMAAAAIPARPANEGGSEHGLNVINRVGRALGVVHRPVAQVKSELDTVLAQIRTMLDSVSSAPIGNFKLDGLEVGLAISAEGSIGIATAGVEASVTLKFAKA